MPFDPSIVYSPDPVPRIITRFLAGIENPTAARIEAAIFALFRSDADEELRENLRELIQLCADSGDSDFPFGAPSEGPPLVRDELRAAALESDDENAIDAVILKGLAPDTPLPQQDDEPELTPPNDPGDGDLQGENATDPQVPEVAKAPERKRIPVTTFRTIRNPKSPTAKRILGIIEKTETVPEMEAQIFSYVAAHPDTADKVVTLLLEMHQFAEGADDAVANVQVDAPFRFRSHEPSQARDFVIQSLNESAQLLQLLASNDYAAADVMTEERRNKLFKLMTAGFDPSRTTTKRLQYARLENTVGITPEIGTTLGGLVRFVAIDELGWKVDGKRISVRLSPLAAGISDADFDKPATLDAVRNMFGRGLISYVNPTRAKALTGTSVVGPSLGPNYSRDAQVLALLPGDPEAKRCLLIGAGDEPVLLHLVDAVVRVYGESTHGSATLREVIEMCSDTGKVEDWATDPLDREHLRSRQAASPANREKLRRVYDEVRGESATFGVKMPEFNDIWSTGAQRDRPKPLAKHGPAVSVDLGEQAEELRPLPRRIGLI